MAIIIDQIIGLCVMVLFIRAWLQLIRADFYNPFSQTVVKLTNPVTQFLRTNLPKGKIDYASLLLAFILLLVKNYLLMTEYPFSFILFKVIYEFTRLIGETVFWVMILKVILSWVSQGRNPVDLVVHQLTQPLVAPIQRVVPPVGMIDFSVMIFLFALYFLEYLHKILFNYIGQQFLNF